MLIITTIDSVPLIRNIYSNMVELDVDHGQTFLECERTPDYLLLSTEGKGLNEIMVMDEEMKTNGHFSDNIDIVNENIKSELPVYFEEGLGTCEEVTVDYDESLSADVLQATRDRSPCLQFKMKQEWSEDETDLSTHLACEDEDYEEHFARGCEDDNTDGEDEETIATFVTAAGQQLALYSVEDSEDVFAVAVYDESGEPPTNFQFLMKSDVEKLIGEGAVKTVKKPMQMKKQLVSTQPPLFSPEPKIDYERENPDIHDFEAASRANFETSWQHKAIMNETRRTILKTNSNMNLSNKGEYHPPKESTNKVRYLMTDETSSSIGETKCDPEAISSDNELIEQSTVQYILLDEDQSESELTFDEIQATLQELKFTAQKPVNDKVLSEKATLDPNINMQRAGNAVIIVKPAECSVINTNQNSPKTNSEKYREVPEIHDQINEHFVNVRPDYSNTSVQNVLTPVVQFSTFTKRTTMNKTPQILKTDSAERSLRLKQNSMDGRTLNLTNNHRSDLGDSHVATGPKIKRSRKQQLTSVNRGDSEIIIQSALLGANEENNNKRRGRRKKKAVPDPDYNPRPVRSKKGKRAAKHARVEIIEIDVDEDQCPLQTGSDIIEITIDDSKEKGSSDKENEVIMVGDSDDESQDTVAKSQPNVQQCEHCARNFRQKNVLDTHLRVCPKLHSKIEKCNKKKFRTNGLLDGDVSNNTGSISKKFSCKVCCEKFDAVVALARHVRIEHRKKFKAKPADASRKFRTGNSTKRIAKELPVKSRVTRLNRRKKAQNPSKTWRSEKLNCIDCGRWFPSTASLTAHALQHATKNSENQVRQCSVCKKLIKTRLLYIRHMRTHGQSSRSKKFPIVQKMQLRKSRQESSETLIERRGRLRKL